VYAVVEPVIPSETRPASSQRGSWRSRTAPQPVVEAPVQAPDEDPAPEDAPDEGGAPEADDAIVLEEDADEGELSELIERPEPEER
jgi:hypothetical protein